MKFQSPVAAGLLVAALSACYAGAAVVQVDFSETPTTPTGDVWNTVSLGTGTTETYDALPLALLDTAGDPTGWSLDLDHEWENSVDTNQTGAFGSLSSPMGIDGAMADRLWQGTNEEGSIYLTGLNPGATYNLAIYASRSSDAGSVRTWSITEGTTLSPDVVHDAHADGYDNAVIIEFANITPTAGGAITITPLNTVAGGDYAQVGAMVISEVPEPASLTLLMGAGLATMMRRRRRA